ncbi:hypothetical protein SteCoe_16748 [Stentor coeruleus]|uniref:Uncharacterized protein n=1 Tax=Stentor coeruleus TaxID=5963 RepID=A0A1R2C0H0_9CILI|nr:hypothetical protein SteCoe_16748 [Stentor coeruleus]
MDRNLVKTKQYDMGLKKPQSSSFKIPKKKVMFQGVNQKYLLKMQNPVNPLTSRPQNFLIYDRRERGIQSLNLSPVYSASFIPTINTIASKELLPRILSKNSPRSPTNSKFFQLHKEIYDRGYLVSGIKKSLHYKEARIKQSPK